MRYTTLIGTGLRVSEIALGAMRFGGDGADVIGPVQARAIFDCFVAAGGNFIDTANVYNAGASESALRELIAAERDHLVIASKYGMAGAGGDIVTCGGSRKAMAASVEASLRRLGTDHLDILYLHQWDPLTPIEEIVRGMDDLVRQGKLIHAGLSNVPAWIAARAVTIAELRGYVRPAILQIAYNLIDRTAEREIVPMAQGLGVGLTAWSPLAQGLLARPVALGEAPLDPRVDAIRAAVNGIAEALGVPAAQVALAWLRHHPAVETIPVVGADTVEQVRDAIDSTGLVLEAEHLATLHAASEIDLGYPSDHLGRAVFRNLLTAFRPESLRPPRS